jgi:hypothetical protein
MIKNISAIALTGLFLAQGCSHVDGYIREHYCNANGAYEKGVNDAMTGRLMDSTWVNNCDERSNHEIGKQYQDGFVTGLKNAPSTIILGQ